MPDKVHVVTRRNDHFDAMLLVFPVENDLDVLHLVEISGKLLDFLSSVVSDLLGVLLMPIGQINSQRHAQFPGKEESQPTQGRRSKC